MCCLVILTICVSIKGVLPPLEWSACSSPIIKFQSLTVNIGLSSSLTNSFIPFPLVHLLSHRTLRCKIPQVNAYQTHQNAMLLSQCIPSVSRSHATYFKHALNTRATHSKFLKLIYMLSTSFIFPFVEPLDRKSTRLNSSHI